MKKSNMFPILTVVAFATVIACVSCISNGTSKQEYVDDLGDTVPASEFALVEDTMQVPVANDTIVYKE